MKERERERVNSTTQSLTHTLHTLTWLKVISWFSLFITPLSIILESLIVTIHFQIRGRENLAIVILATINYKETSLNPAATFFLTPSGKTSTWECKKGWTIQSLHGHMNIFIPHLVSYHLPLDPSSKPIHLLCLHDGG